MTISSQEGAAVNQSKAEFEGYRFKTRYQEGALQQNLC